MQRGMKVMPSLGLREILGILAIVVVLFGAGRLSGVGGALGKSIREFRKEREGLDEVPVSSNNTSSSKGQYEEEKQVLRSADLEQGEKGDNK